jgi:hypothetical protein
MVAPAAGWTVRADTAWPAAEIRSELTLTRDNLQATLPVIALRDLRRHRWNLRYTCGDTTTSGAATVKTDPALWYWGVQWVNLEAQTDSITRWEWAPGKYGFDLWFTRPTLIRGLRGQLLDGTAVHSADTSYASSRLRIGLQGVGWVRPGGYELKVGQFVSATDWARWNGAAYAGGDLRLCRQGIFEDYPGPYANASIYYLVLEALP